MIVAAMPYLIGALLVGVVATLFAGLVGMVGDGNFNRRHANRIMRLRVGLQLASVVALASYVLMTRL